MARINVLPKSVAELIAAGEVVERPMSAVKELIENSIDAGADNVTVEIKNGGVRYIRVTDNGCGMAKEDVRTAFVSHATSKIKNASDLNAIFTLGFRGEALPSIAAVSRLSLLTRTPEEETGTGFVIEGGEEISFEEAGCPAGTTIIVRDLFFNTPARMKFLKRDMTEGTYVADAVTKAALSHPEVKFTFIKDGKRALATPGGDMYSAVYALFGRETAESLIKCDYEDEQLGIHGFISKPLSNRPNRNMQFFFVNGRCVRIPAAAPALDEAYKNSIMTGKFPMCFLSLTLPAEKTDVNVHPAKTEIRFSEETKLFEAVFYAARSALSKGDTARPSVSLPQKRNITASPVPRGTQLSLETAKKAAWGFPPEKSEDKPPEKSEDKPPEKSEDKPAESVQPSYQGIEAKKIQSLADDSAPFSELLLRDGSGDRNDPSAPVEKTTGYNVPWLINEKAVVAEEKTAPPEEKTVVTEEKAPEPFRIVGEAFGTYIIVEQGNKLLLIDKHAAHERMIFNEITANKSSNGAQLLLTPVPVVLSSGEYAAVLDNLKVFGEAGFSVEDFGSDTVIVRECPVELTNADIVSVITEMAGKLLKGSLRPVPEKLEWLYHSAACRAAVKAGDELKPEETESFVKRLLADGGIKYCPHGRPVMYELSKREIEKQFGRLG